MKHIIIFSIGKTREKWLQLALEEYEKRLTGIVSIDWRLFTKEKDFEKALLLQKNGFIMLDPNGDLLTSEGFSEIILPQSSLSFAIGGPTGFSADIKKAAKYSLSFSKLTFTHQAIRLLLLEQIYRSIQIDKGTDYHK